jgi:Flp pilus assembly pilin Flp
MLFFPKERAQSLIEYGLILVLLALIVIAILVIFWGAIIAAFVGLVFFVTHIK